MFIKCNLILNVGQFVLQIDKCEFQFTACTVNNRSDVLMKWYDFINNLHLFLIRWQINWQQSVQWQNSSLKTFHWQSRFWDNAKVDSRWAQLKFSLYVVSWTIQLGDTMLLGVCVLVKLTFLRTNTITWKFRTSHPKYNRIWIFIQHRHIFNFKIGVLKLSGQFVARLCGTT